MDEFAVRYSIDKLVEKLDELETIHRKFNPLNFNSTDTYMSIEEKYRVRDALGSAITHIRLLKEEVN